MMLSFLDVPKIGFSYFLSARLVKIGPMVSDGSNSSK